jgi:D-xylulose reductase
VLKEKLDIVASYGGVIPIDASRGDTANRVMDLTEGWGADVVFEASGNAEAVPQVFDLLCPGGCVVLVGMPVHPVSLDIVKAQAKEARIETIFRYANVYPRALELIGSGKIDLKPLITETYAFEDSVAAYEYAVHPSPSSVKIQIKVAD